MMANEKHFAYQTFLDLEYPNRLEYLGHMSLRPLDSAAEVCEVLGVSKIAKITLRNYRVAHNWKRFGRFPPNTFTAMQAALEAAGYTAPSSLWGMVPSDEPREAAE